MPRIDAHIHYPGDHPDCIGLLARLDLKLLNVCVAHQAGGHWRLEAEIYGELASQYPHHYAWCTTFDPPDFADGGYVDRAIEGLERDFAAGAVACKVWKNIGMAIRKPSGGFLMVDDPLFDPIYAYLEGSGKALLMHIGEPLACWQPLREGDRHYDYYSKHPEWHMYGKPEYPSHQQLIEARDRVLAKHSKLRVVGAHLGSLEYDVVEMAKRLERYPNFAVDTSARLLDLAEQELKTVRQFFLDYQDRILFGTDLVQRERVSSLPGSARQDHLRWLQDKYAASFAFFEVEGEVELSGQKVRGLGLPQAILEKLYYVNAAKWYAGL